MPNSPNHSEASHIPGTQPLKRSSKALKEITIISITLLGEAKSILASLTAYAIVLRNAKKRVNCFSPLQPDNAPIRAKGFERPPLLKHAIGINFLICYKPCQGSALQEASEFQMKFSRRKMTILTEIDKALKRKLTRNMPKEPKDQTLTSQKEGKR